MQKVLDQIGKINNKLESLSTQEDSQTSINTQTATQLNNLQQQSTELQTQINELNEFVNVLIDTIQDISSEQITISEDYGQRKCI